MTQSRIEGLREAAAKVLDSETFRRAGRARQLLEHVVSRAVEGRSEEIKENTLAFEVFRRQDYDPKTDSVVRVEASKLRALLAKFYQEEGALETQRIEIPKGSYIPILCDTAPVPTPVEPSAPLAAPAHEQPRVRTTTRWIFPIAAILVILALAVYTWWPRPSKTTPTVGGAVALALIPFHDLDENRVSALSQGLTDELVEALKPVSGFRVATRLESNLYPAAAGKVRQIGRDMGIAAVLQGSVRRDTDGARLTLELADARNGMSLWTRTGSVPVQGTLEDQRSALAPFLTEINSDLCLVRKALLVNAPQNQQAYHQFMQAAITANHADQFEQSNSLFQAALRLEPDYALGWAMYANSLLAQVDWRAAPIDTLLPRAIAATDKALALDPDLSEAHLARAITRAISGADLRSSEAMFQRALQLDPDNAEARFAYARLILVPEARYEQAQKLLREAIALDPVHVSHRNELGKVLMLSGRYEESTRVLRESLLMFDAPAAHVWLGMLHLRQGNADSALHEMQQARNLTANSWTLGYHGFALAKLGRTQQAIDVLTELSGMLRDSSLLDRILLLRALGRDNETAAALRELAQQSAFDRRRIEYDPRWLMSGPNPRLR